MMQMTAQPPSLEGLYSKCYSTQVFVNWIIMKVKLEFDSVTDSEHVILLAVRAQDAYWLLDDLLDQLSQWIGARNLASIPRKWP